MKKGIIILLAILFAGANCNCDAQGKRSLRRTAEALKVDELNVRKARLERELDSIRNAGKGSHYGVTPQREEQLDIRRDSLSLALSSELLRVKLELDELGK